MNTVSIRAITIVGLILMLTAVSTWAGPPPNNDSSLNGNTAGGTIALGVNGAGEDNSAWGAAALSG
jgi:hypothetical protein